MKKMVILLALFLTLSIGISMPIQLKTYQNFNLQILKL